MKNCADYSSHKASEVNDIFLDNIKNASLFFSYKISSYANISDYVEVHIQEVSNAETTKTTLQWVHIAIANSKRWLLGIHPMIRGKYLQNYLNKFYYKLNRRYFGDNLFNILSITLAKSYFGTIDNTVSYINKCDNSTKGVEQVVKSNYLLLLINGIYDLIIFCYKTKSKCRKIESNLIENVR